MGKKRHDWRLSQQCAEDPSLQESAVCEVSKDRTAIIIRVRQFKSTLFELLHTEEGTLILGNINELFIQKQNITSQ